MAIYKLIYRLTIQKTLAKRLTCTWKETPTVEELSIWIIYLAEFLYTVYYVCDKDSAKSGAAIVSNKLNSQQREYAECVIMTRNAICHLFGTRQYYEDINTCRKYWRQIKDLFDYVNATEVETNLLDVYCERYSISVNCAHEEINRLYTLYNVQTLEELFPHLQEDFLE